VFTVDAYEKAKDLLYWELITAVDANLSVGRSDYSRNR